MRRIRLLESLEGLLIVSTPSPLWNESLCSMGMIIRRGFQYILTPSLAEESPVGEESNDESNSESSLSLATELAGSTIAHPRHRSHF